MTSLDKLTIDTPEQLALDFPLAGVGSRFLALLIDTLLQVVAGIVLGLLLLLVFFAVGPSSSGMWVVAIWIIAYFLIQFGYFAIFESLWNGQTPGKRQMQLRVIKDDGRPITVYDAVARNLLRLIDNLPGIYGVGILSMMFSKQNKRLGDYVAGTVVVHEKKLEGMQPTWQAAPAVASAAGAYGVARLSPGEVQLIEAFLDRRSELDVHLRGATAAQIAQRIAATLGIPPEERKSAELFLEEVHAQRRNLQSFGG